MLKKIVFRYGIQIAVVTGKVPENIHIVMKEYGDIIL